MHRQHNEKEWWRERRLAPATFMGFPDPSKQDLRGGSMYIEQMDAVTLAVVIDKCVNEGLLEDVSENKRQRRDGLLSAVD